jgi:hypothetical protein
MNAGKRREAGGNATCRRIKPQTKKATKNKENKKCNKKTRKNTLHLYERLKLFSVPLGCGGGS